MSNLLKVLNEIEEAKGSKAKKVVLVENKENQLLKILWRLTYSRKNFHTRILYPLRDDNSVGEKDFLKVVYLLEMLSQKSHEGKPQKVFISEILARLHNDCIEVYNRAIKGNLRCGIGATVANSVWGDKFIPKFPVMLISPYCAKKAAKIMKGSACIQLKSDGVRGICHADVVDNSLAVSFFSRQGEKFHGLEDTFSHEVEAMYKSMTWLMGDSIMIDGEFTCIDEDGKHNPSKASGIMNKAISGSATEEELASLTYLVWDLGSSSEVEDPEDKPEPYYSRLENLVDAVSESEVKKIQVVQTWIAKDLEQVAEIYQEIVDGGNEGVVLKSMNNIWKDTRVTDCIKYKEKHQAEFKIISHYLGETGKEFQNVLGGFVVESACGKVTTKTGSGLSFYDRGILVGDLDKKGKPTYLKDEDGNHIKDPNFDYEHYHGNIVTLEYNKRTKTKSGDRETFSLRFPIVKQFRLDKSSANTLEEMVVQEKSSRGLRL